MIECPHFLHGSVASGGRSPGMKTLAWQAGLLQVTNFRLLMPLHPNIAYSCDKSAQPNVHQVLPNVTRASSGRITVNFHSWRRLTLSKVFIDINGVSSTDPACYGKSCAV